LAAYLIEQGSGAAVLKAHSELFRGLKAAFGARIRGIPRGWQRAERLEAGMVFPYFRALRVRFPFEIRPS